MATVEQLDTQSSGLAALSNTLDIFNDFKDDKDSDEESFHLPMLDCDDDLDSNIKDAVTSEVTSSTELKDLLCQNGESEDDILNKFETRGTPDIDPKIEDKLLDDIDDLCENKPDESAETKFTDTLMKQKQTSEKDSKNPVNETKEIDRDKQTVEELSPNVAEVAEPSKKVKGDRDEAETEIVSNEQHETGAESSVAESNSIIEDENMETQHQEQFTEEEKIPQRKEICDKADQINKDTSECTEVTNCAENDLSIAENKIDDDVRENDEKKTEKIKNNSADDIKDDVVENVTTEDIVQERSQEIAQINEVNKDEALLLEEEDIEGKNGDKLNKENVVEAKQKVQTESELSEGKGVDSMEVDIEHAEAEVNNSCQIIPNQLKSINENDSVDVSNAESVPEVMDVDVSDSDKDKEPIVDEKFSDGENKENIEDDINNQLTENIIESEQIEDKLLEDCSTELNSAESNQKVSDKLGETTAINKFVGETETDHSKTENVGPEKCENSNDSSKSQNLDCDDLFDISVIRDADEDNASAIAEHDNDVRSREKSDNDDQDEGSEKADNELDESEMEQEESLLTTDKDDNMDFEDGNSSNLADQENTVSGNTSDSETKDDTEIGDSSNSNISSVLMEKTNKINEHAVANEKSQTAKVIVEPIDDINKSVVTDDQDSLKENSLKLGAKRPLNETENGTEAANKKMKLSENASINDKKKTTKKVKTLITFEKYMQNKKLENKLTRSDLEQFCLQKICEAIMHKTDVGELHQTIKKQEQIIENLRKDLQQLTKQTRDLDIVNKKLMNELRVQNGIKKPLVPLKITRSVGLQVKLNVNIETNPRRKTPVTANSRTPTPNTTPRQRAITPANAGVVRQVAASPRKTPPTTTPLLSQALQSNRQAPPANTTKRPPIRPKPTEPQKPNNPGVIDLTDEDDKASKAAAATPVKIITKTTPKINVVQNKATPNKTVNVNAQNKTIAVGQVKTTTVGAKVTTPARTVATLPQGVRLTPTQVKNGSITIPASVVTSNSGTTQLMYVVQPTSSLGQVVTSTAGGAQKAVLLNFQPTNGVLTSALNGSAVSVIPTKTTNTVQLKTVAVPRKHPAPLPIPPPIAVNASLKPLLPKPHLSIRKTDTGIILQWRMPYNLDVYEGIASYQLFAYQETNAAPSTDMWRKVGDVKALALPMACTLTQFADKNKYYFAVRSVDVHKRIGAFSDPEEISL